LSEKSGTDHDKTPRSNKQNGKNRRIKKTHACPKTRKEEGKVPALFIIKRFSVNQKI